ncbi:MAG: hypothetical protein KFB95_05760 [Simkaniaceae bacterium]|nr:MAG: hypothetical protein KFB95_05760 [Simkaniaceae bacterium]
MKKVILGLLLSTLLLTGCHVSSRTSMYGSGGRTSYNIAAQNTTNQELLLNLVRLRYSDTPYFLELNGITTQFNFSGKVSPSIKIPGFDNDNPAAFGAEMGWSNQPTIQYSPLEGKDFAIQLMQPLDLRIIQGLLFTGWDVDRVFRLLIQHMADISNASSASGPIPLKPPHYKKFFECLHLLRHFQALGQLQVGIRYIPTGEKHISEDDACKERPNAIQISFPVNGEDSDRLADLLEGIKKSKGRYVLNMRQAFNEAAEIGIMTRSLLSTMYYLSLGVAVPPRDIEAGTVAMTKNSDGTFFNWEDVVGDLFNVKSSPHYPKNAYLAVAYRGNWFYIDDGDINSKRTFVLLQQIYNLQARQQEKETPILSIPLGSPG